MKLFTTFLIFCVVALSSSYGMDQLTIFNVLNYGAVGDATTDDSKAFLAAWTAACGADVDSPVVSIPEGKTFLLTPVKFEGPCKSSNINFYVEGNIVAPSEIKAWKGQEQEEKEKQKQKNWILFSNVNGLLVNGSGQIDGKGSIWWNQFNRLRHSSKMNSGSDFRPAAVKFEMCNDIEISGLTYMNSPRSHIKIDGCKGVSIHNLHIVAPATSPNTDGIDINQSTNVQIHHCIIGTGDDCIAIGGGSSNINITGVACGPGHGISVGSLGENGETAKVEEVNVRNCSFNGTRNGARIKSWQGGSGYARKITFQDIILIATANPIDIDQYYCPSFHHCKNKTSAVQVSDVSYDGFHGTSISDEAIKLSCSETVGCTNIVLSNINITSTYPNQVIYASCSNAHGSSIATIPIVNCLLP